MPIKQMLKNFKEAKGFSLLELSVTIGLVGLVSLFTMKIMENQSRSVTDIETSAEINTTVSTIAQTINDPRNCAALFSGKNINSTLNGLSYTIPDPPAGRVRQLLQTRQNGRVYQNFFIRDANHIVLSSDSNSGTAILTITFSTQAAALSQRINLLQQNNPRTIIRQIMFNVVTNGSTIVSCGPVISTKSLIAKENACLAMKSLGAEWVPATGRCRLREQSCGWGQVVRGFNQNGDILCVDAHQQVPAHQIFDFGHTQNCQLGTASPQRWSLTVFNGKIRLRCTL